MPKVMFYEVFKEEELAIRKHWPKNIAAEFTSKTIQTEESLTLSAPIISIRTQSCIPPEWAHDIKGILTRSAGYDHLVAYKERTGATIPCGYLPDYCSRAVAEQAILMMMALFRKLRKQIRNFEQFKRDDITGYECFGKKLLVVGVGRIGSRVVEIASGLGMKVKGVDIDAKRDDIKYISLEEGVSWADAVISAVPLTEQTKGMLNYNLFQQASPGIVFVNISRGEVSPCSDMQRLIEEEILGGLGMDVYEEEGLLAESLRSAKVVDDEKVCVIKKMNERENVVFTPHNAFNTHEAVERKAEQSVKAILSFLAKQQFPDPVPEK